MNRRIKAGIIFLLITVVSLCGCGSVQGTTTPAYTIQYVESEEIVESTSDTYQNIVAADSKFTKSITETITESDDPSSKIDWQTFSYEFTDTDGYKIQETLKVSPMISSNSADYLNAAWTELGEDPNELLTVDYGKGHYEWKMGGVTDALFIVGEISAKNVTQGYDFSENNQHSEYLYFLMYEKEGFQVRSGDINVDCLKSSDYPWEFTKTMFSTPSLYSGSGGVIKSFTKLSVNGGEVVIPKGMNDYYLQELHIGTAAMKSNSWGPVSFVMMFPNKHTPNTPNGYELYDYLGFAFGDKTFTLDIIE